MLEKEKFPQDYFPEVRPGGPSGHRLPEHLLFRMVTWEGDLRACLWVDSPSAAAPLYCSLPGRVGDARGLLWVVLAERREGAQCLWLEQLANFLIAVSWQRNHPRRCRQIIIGSLGAWSVSGSVWPVTCPAQGHMGHVPFPRVLGAASERCSQKPGAWCRPQVPGGGGCAQIRHGQEAFSWARCTSSGLVTSM